jgi:hypothetical protein
MQSSRSVTPGVSPESPALSKMRGESLPHMHVKVVGEQTCPELQSKLVQHLCPALHPLQAPPQSMSDSLPSWRWSKHGLGMHACETLSQASLAQSVSCAHMVPSGPRGQLTQCPPSQSTMTQAQHGTSEVQIAGVPQTVQPAPPGTQVSIPSGEVRGIVHCVSPRAHAALQGPPVSLVVTTSCAASPGASGAESMTTGASSPVS